MPLTAKANTHARILIIEDNLSNLELMTYLLVAFGHEVVKTETGQAGLEAAGQSSFDVILCDIHLPDMDGGEIARRLKASAHSRTVPLIAVTALAMLGDRERLLTAGFDGYIPKPLDPESFVTLVEQFAERRPSEPRRAEMTPAKADGQKVTSRGSVLILDDLAENRYFLRFVLEPRGFEVEEAGTVAEALRKIRSKEPDLIISDINLANSEDGEEFLSRIKQETALAHIPVILITSTDKPSNAKVLRIKNAGAEAFLVRPLSPEIVVRAIESALPAVSHDQ